MLGGALRRPRPGRPGLGSTPISRSAASARSSVRFAMPTSCDARHVVDQVGERPPHEPGADDADPDGPPLVLTALECLVQDDHGKASLGRRYGTASIDDQVRSMALSGENSGQVRSLSETMVTASGQSMASRGSS